MRRALKLAAPGGAAILSQMLGLRIEDVLEAGQSAANVSEYERLVLPALVRCIPCDQAFFVRHGALSEFALGFDQNVRRNTAGHYGHYQRELAPLRARALARGGVAVDREHFGSSELERRRYYAEVMRPHGGKSTLLGYLSFRGRVLAAVVLGRSTPTFSDGEQASLRALMPALSLCDMAVYRGAPPPSGELTSLSAREREVLSYLSLGYSNREIGVACGTSPKTVRNQLSAVFRKIGASTRAEAVAIHLGRL